jgi:hypothetical protein
MIQISHLYRIDNTKNGKYYIGKHNGVEQNGYWGSGLKLKHSISKYGVETFKYTVLVISDEDTIFELEKNLVTTQLIENDNRCMNLMCGGFGGGIPSQSTRQKLSEAKINHPMYLNKHRGEKIRQALLGSKLSEERKDKIRQKAIGRIHSDESKKKRNESISKLIWINNGKSNYRINKELKESYLNQGFLLGRTSFTKEARENIKKSVIGRKHSEETKLKISQSNKLTKKGKLNG